MAIVLHSLMKSVLKFIRVHFTTLLAQIPSHYCFQFGKAWCDCQSIFESNIRRYWEWNGNFLLNISHDYVETELKTTVIERCVCLWSINYTVFHHLKWRFRYLKNDEFLMFETLWNPFQVSKWLFWSFSSPSELYFIFPYFSLCSHVWISMRSSKFLSRHSNFFLALFINSFAVQSIFEAFQLPVNSDKVFLLHILSLLYELA